MVRPGSNRGLSLRRTLGRAIGCVVALVTLMPAGAANPPPTHPSGAATPTQPNVVLILTDDQRGDTLWAMPTVQAELVAHGVTFDNAFVVNSLCCPSRVSILTGQYSHTSMVYGNTGQYGGFSSFHGDASTVATWLHDGGYRTALVGKYLNEYDEPYIPPGWDHWFAFSGAPSGAAYYNYTINDDGTDLSYGSDPEDYSTDVLAAEAVRFIRETDPQQPLFLEYSVKAPHVPYTPARRHMGAFSDLDPYRPPNYNEEDVSDKPAWVRGLELLTEERQATVDRQRKNAYRSLLAVDEAVARIVGALTDTGRLANTLIVFASDNGLGVGEHRWTNKKTAYEESIRIPLVIRYDPLVLEARSDAHLVLNIDIAPTFAEAAGVPAPGVDGVSLVPLLQSPDPGSWRTDFLIEHSRVGDTEGEGPPPVTIPSYCAVRSEGFLYVSYWSYEEELYDLTMDPYELQNVATDPGYLATLISMRARRAALCVPLPPH